MALERRCAVTCLLAHLRLGPSCRRCERSGLRVRALLLCWWAHHLVLLPSSASRDTAPQTIIECLKHAVTGEWPPNSHAGKSFVHDPKARLWAR